MKVIEFLENEYWYPSVINDGYLFPLDSTSKYEIDFSYNNTYNQINPLLLSSKGRYIYLDEGGFVSFNNGQILLDAPKIELNEDGKCLKDAQQNALSKFSKSLFIPDEVIFKNPQLCSWIALGYEQTTENILSFAKTYIQCGYKPGVLIIDDGWATSFGTFKFDLKKIPNPKGLINELHSLGFKVLLWLCPYIPLDSEFKSVLVENNALIMDGIAPALVRFFDGEGYAIDFRSQYGKQFFINHCKRLQNEYGADGFKLDCGDEQYFVKRNKVGNENNRLYIDSLTEEVPNLIIEARSVYKHHLKNVIQRLSDKFHQYDVHLSRDDINGEYLTYGLSTIIPDMQLLGLAGYFYGCADMVGGGNINDKDLKKDDELLVRWSQASACFPCVQFSYQYWESKSDLVKESMKKSVAIHDYFSDYIVKLAKNAAETNEPIIRYLEYEFPHCGLEKVTDEFMLGDKYLVAPIVAKDVTRKTVIFPKGYLFRNITDGSIYKNQHTFDVDLKTLLIFEKMEEN